MRAEIEIRKTMKKNDEAEAEKRWLKGLTGDCTGNQEEENGENGETIGRGQSDTARQIRSATEETKEVETRKRRETGSQEQRRGF